MQVQGFCLFAPLFSCTYYTRFNPLSAGINGFLLRSAGPKYIAFALQSPQNAAGQLDRLEEAILSLDEMPERYPIYDKKPWNDRNLRIMPVDNYLVFYIPQNDRKTVRVLRIMYGGRDIDRQLKKI